MRKLWIWLTLFPTGRTLQLSEEIQARLNVCTNRRDRRYLSSLYRKAKGTEHRLAVAEHRHVLD